MSRCAAVESIEDLFGGFGGGRGGGHCCIQWLYHLVWYCWSLRQPNSCVFLLRRGHGKSGSVDDAVIVVAVTAGSIHESRASNEKDQLFRRLHPCTRQDIYHRLPIKDLCYSTNNTPLCSRDYILQPPPSCTARHVSANTRPSRNPHPPPPHLLHPPCPIRQ